MKSIGLIALILLALSGCNKSPEPNGQIVKIVSDCGNNNISISDIKGRKKSDGFMQAQVIGLNSSGSYEKLEYRVVWFDKQGFKIESILSKWKSTPAYAHQPFHINAVSPSTKAKTFRIYIKNEGETICDKHYNGY